MFEIDYSDFGDYTLGKVSNMLTGEYFTFLPDCGATLNQLVLQSRNGKNHSLISGNRSYEDFLTEGKAVFKGSKLFPFPNRINSGFYSFEKEQFQLPINFPAEGHAIHGLVTESKFRIKEIHANKEEGKVVLDYQYNREQEGYPFRFNLEVIFKLDHFGFSCKTIVKNLDKRSIPVGDGWHPYFETGTIVDDLYISIPAQKEIEVNNKMIPTGKVIINDKYSLLEKIENKNFDACFKLIEGDNLSFVKLIDLEKEIRMNIWIETGKDKYRYVQVYTPPSRNCIAIEPMTCMPDAFNNKNDLIIIPSGEKREFLWGVHLY